MTRKPGLRQTGIYTPRITAYAGKKTGALRAF